ncbi:hypothetical protein C8R44DRAFT_800653 [Mycena epipterygia]|nr:hypothetical protein C8R44DRAFT_800653 [Mycena epipterygia]
MARKFAFFGPYIGNGTTPAAKELRLRIIDAHKAGIQKNVAAGAIKFGGPFYNDDGAGEGAEDRPFGGSFFLMEAESRAEALAIIEADEYYKYGLVSRLTLLLAQDRRACEPA